MSYSQSSNPAPRREMTNLDPMYFYLKLHIQLPNNARVQMDGHVKSLGASHIIMPWYVSLSIAPPSPSEIWSWIGPCGLPKKGSLSFKSFT